jgi:hypothetical protein
MRREIVAFDTRPSVTLSWESRSCTAYRPYDKIGQHRNPTGEDCRECPQPAWLRVPVGISANIYVANDWRSKDKAEQEDTDDDYDCDVHKPALSMDN